MLSLNGLDNFSSASIEPQTSDPQLKIETVAEGLDHPTSMAFLGPNDILVLEKNNGKVPRVVNNTLLPSPSEFGCTYFLEYNISFASVILRVLWDVLPPRT